VFRVHNLELTEKMYEHHNDREAMLAVAKQGRDQLTEQMLREREEREERGGRALGDAQAEQAPMSPYPAHPAQAPAAAQPS